MRRIALITFWLLMPPAVAVFAEDAASRKEAWGRLLIENGLRPGIGTSPADWNRTVSGLEELGTAAGIAPGPGISKEQFHVLLERARMRAPDDAAPVSDAISVGGSTASASPGIPTADVPLTPLFEPKRTEAVGRPGTEAAAPSGEGLAEKRISLDLRDMDIVEALRIFSRQSGLNIVVGKNVAGRVTVFLNKVDLWQALRSILETRGLAFVRSGDLIEVLTESDYQALYGEVFALRKDLATFAPAHLTAQEAGRMLEPLKSRAGLLLVNEVGNTLIVEDGPAQIGRMERLLADIDRPVETRVFKLNYAPADDVLSKISGSVSKDFGKVQADKRTNTIVVRDNPARVREIADVIRSFDVVSKAVLIEAKIVQVTLSDGFQWGINWQGVDWTYFFNRMRDYHLGGRVVQNLSLVPAETVSGPHPTARGVTASLGVMEKPDFKAVVNFLNTAGTTNLLSSPRVMALNNQEAKIHVGSKVAKITRTLLNVGSTTSNPVTTENVEFLDVGVKLAVTPSVGDDGMITLKVKPEVSSVESTITTSEGSSIPVIRVSEAEASLVVKDGITVVLGGLIEDSRARTDVRVPVLGSLPIVGALFRSRDRTRLKTELVIFLTPRIVTGEAVSPEAQTKFDLMPDGSGRPPRGVWKRLFGRRRAPDVH